MRVLILCLLVVFGSCAYNATIAKKLLIASAATYATDAQISKWTCKVCANFPLTKVIVLSLRLNHLLIQSWIFMVSQAILNKIMLLLLLSREKLISKTGLPILTLLKSNILLAPTVLFIKVSTMPSKELKVTSEKMCKLLLPYTEMQIFGLQVSHQEVLLESWPLLILKRFLAK